MGLGFTAILRRASEGDDAAREEVARHVLDEIREIAARLMRHEQNGHTLQPTLLATEAIVRLLGRNEDGVCFNNRAHFLAIAATEIRRILIDHANKRNAIKRGGEWRRTPLDVAVTSEHLSSREVDVLAIHEALDRLATFDATGARIIEMRFFGGMTMDEISTALSIPLRTIERDWQAARAWMHKELADGA